MVNNMVGVIEIIYFVLKLAAFMFITLHVVFIALAKDVFDKKCYMILYLIMILLSLYYIAI